MKYKKTISLLLIILLSMSLMGCRKGNEYVEQAKNYVSNVANGKWEQVLEMSTGDQLAIYMQMVPTLRNIKQTSSLKRLDVVESFSRKNTAFVTIHYVRSVEIPGYGSMMDDKQVMVSMRKVDGQWKVFKLDIVLDN